MPAAYRAEQIGSFLRPRAVLEARAARAQGTIALERLREVEDEAVLNLLRMQREVGIEVYSDGELRRGSFLSGVAEAIDGFVPDTISMEWHGPNATPEPSAAQVVGARLHQRQRLTEHESAFVRQHAPGPVKVTVPSPTLFTDVSYKRGVTDQFYPTRAALLAELAEIIRREVLALVNEGVQYIQLDAPRYTYYVDAGLRAQLQAGGIDPDEALDQALEADAFVLADAQRAGVTVGIHLCRGNQQSRWFAAGGYEPIAEKLFATLPVDRFLLEFDDDRAGNFEPLRFVPNDKMVVLGLVTTKSPALETQNDLLRRIDAAARYVPLERLALSPQCGFASVAAGNLISEDDQRRKLELVVETVHKVWG